MSMQKEASLSVDIFEAALGSEEPIKELFEIAARLIQDGEIGNLSDIDVMLIERFIEYLRGGSSDELDAFQAAVLSFTDSEIGDRLKANKEGQKYYYRWQHFHDLCGMAVENYDPKLAKRFVESRKHGKGLLTLLYQNREGIRHNELSKRLGVSPQYLSKLLREFQEHDLITRERKNKVSIIRLGAAGRAYISENFSFYETAGPVSPGTYKPGNQTAPRNAAMVAERKIEYNKTDTEDISSPK